MIEMPVQPTLGIMPARYNNNGVGLLTLLGVGFIVPRVTKVTMET